MSTNIRSNFLDFFTGSKLPALEAVIQAKHDSYASMIPVFFNESTMDSDITQTTTMSGLRNPEEKPENVPVTFQTLRPGFSKTFTAKTMASAYRVSKEFVDDGKIDPIQRATISFAKGFFEVKEFDVASIFDDGFTVNGYDGVPLFSAAHPLENGNGAVGVNMTTAAELSVTSYRDLRNVLQDTVNEDGQLVRYMAQYLLVSQENQDVAEELIKSTHNPENANNTINTIYNKISLVPGGYWPYLSSTTAFFMICPKEDHGLTFKRRAALEIDTDYDKKAFAHEIIANERYTYGYGTWRGVVGNAGL